MVRRPCVWRIRVGILSARCVTADGKEKKESETSQRSEGESSSLQLRGQTPQALERSRSVGSEHRLQILCCRRLQERQRQENPRFLRVQLVGCDEAQLVVVELDVPSDKTGRHARAP